MAGEREGHSLQATALVNEAYVRLVDGTDVAWHDRTHFLAVAARMMRRILVDHARARHAQKRGGDGARVTFDEALVVTNEPRQNFVALDDALQALGEVRRAEEPRRRAPVLRRAERGGDRVGPEGVARYRDARLAAGESLAAGRDARRSPGRRLTPTPEPVPVAARPIYRLVAVHRVAGHASVLIVPTAVPSETILSGHDDVVVSSQRNAPSLTDWQGRERQRYSAAREAGQHVALDGESHLHVRMRASTRSAVRMREGIPLPGAVEIKRLR